MLRMIYQWLKVFLDGTGLMWKNQWAMDLKLTINDQCTNYLGRLQQADNDTFAVLLRGVLVVTSIGLVLLSGFSIKMGIFKTQAIDSIFTASCLMVYAIGVCDTKKEFWGKIKSISKYIKKGLGIVGVIFLVIVTIIAIFKSNPNLAYLDNPLEDKLVQDTAMGIIVHIPLKYYGYFLLTVALPFAIFAIPFYFNRWFVFPLLRKLIAKALKDYHNEPFKALAFVLSIISAIGSTCYNIFK